MGEGIVEKLKQEFDLDVEWKGVEIHPETPAGGRPLTELFAADSIDRMMGHLRTMGAAFGITFADRPFLSNSRMALQAAEFARETGSFQPLHEALFAAYFSQGLDIGSTDVLREIGRETGLDGDAMMEALQGGRYLPKLASAQQDATSAGVTGVPTFIVGNKKTIVGAQALDVFRQTIKSIKSKA